MKKSLVVLSALLVLVLAVGIAQAETLEVWIMQPGNPDATEAFFDKVNEDFGQMYPGVDVEVSFIPWLAGQDQFIQAHLGGIAPDVAEMGTTWTPQLTYMGALENLSGRIAELDYNNEFIPALVESAEYDGDLYGLPWYAGNRAIFYRQDWFEEKGITEFPKTWDELVEVAKLLTEDTNGDGQIDRYGFAANGGSQHEFMPMIWMTGGEPLVETDEGWVSNFTSPEAIRAFELYADLYTTHKVSPEASVTWSVLDARQAFETGVIGMYIDVSVMANNFQNSEIGDKFNVAPIPEVETTASFTGGSHLVLFEQSDKKEMAWEYLKLMMEVRHLQGWADLTGFFPGRMDAIAPEMEQDPYLSVFYDQLPYGRHYPAIPAWGNIEGSGLLTETIQRIMMGEGTIEQAMQSLEREVNSIIRATD